MTSPNTAEKASQDLWNDYFFLTKEMLKFLDEKDMELFYELMEQRETLQNMIEAARDDEFRLSIPGQKLIQSVQGINNNITSKLQSIVNNNRNQRNTSRAYEGLGTDNVGIRMDRQT